MDSFVQTVIASNYLDEIKTAINDSDSSEDPATFAPPETFPDLIRFVVDQARAVKSIDGVKGHILLDHGDDPSSSIALTIDPDTKTIRGEVVWEK